MCRRKDGRVCVCVSDPTQNFSVQLGNSHHGHTSLTGGWRAWGVIKKKEWRSLLAAGLLSGAKLRWETALQCV